MSDTDRSTLDRLTKGDRFRVDCHEKSLQVQSTGPFVGAIVLDAYDEGGAQWPVAEVDGQLYLGYSQVTPAGEQQRAKEIGSVTLVSEQHEQTALVTSTDGGNDRRQNTSADQ